MNTFAEKKDELNTFVVGACRVYRAPLPHLSKAPTGLRRNFPDPLPAQQPSPTRWFTVVSPSFSFSSSACVFQRNTALVVVTGGEGESSLILCHSDSDTTRHNWGAAGNYKAIKMASAIQVTYLLSIQSLGTS